MFWLTLRQYVRERRHARRGEGEKYALEPVASPNSRKSIPEIFSKLYCMHNVLNIIELKLLTQESLILHELHHEKAFLLRHKK